MNTIYFDSDVCDEVRRKKLYEGQIFVFSPCSSTIALCNFAREMIEEAFGSLDPRTAQYHMPVEEYVAIASKLKPQFIHHPRTKSLIQNILKEFECHPQRTYLDVPRLRTCTSDGYLTNGVGYAFHPHRDTWYSAPMSQLNWWLPIYDIESESAMAFHPKYWNEPVENDSKCFNYYKYNQTGRKNASQHIKSDTRIQPKPQQTLELDPQVRVVCSVGGVVIFSGAHLHSTVPNTSGLTRYSIDFRTVNIDDVIARGGAPNIDSAPVGTSLRDFMRCVDLIRPSQDILDLYETEESLAEDGMLIYQPAENELSQKSLSASVSR
ncbi:MAG TPA: phytanoyl-CoA dioxygenase family protein [Stenomitos sp.]